MAAETAIRNPPLAGVLRISPIKGWAFRQAIPASLVFQLFRKIICAEDRILLVASEPSLLTLSMKDHEVVQVEGHPVQHNRGDYLIHLVTGFEVSGDAPP